MGKVLNVDINPDIVLDESKVKSMPHDLKQHLLATMTIAMDRYQCDWRELSWKVKFVGGQPVISVKRKNNNGKS